MKAKIRKTDKVIIPAIVDCFCCERSGRVTDVFTHGKMTFVTVRYDEPDWTGRNVAVVFEHQVIKKRKK